MNRNDAVIIEDGSNLPDDASIIRAHGKGYICLVTDGGSRTKVKLPAKDDGEVTNTEILHTKEVTLDRKCLKDITEVFENVKRKDND